MKKTVNTSHVRAMNQRAILEAICQHESVSKAELARQLNLSKPAMAVNVSEFISKGIIEEIGEGECSEGGGRKPILLRLKKDHKFIVAVDFFYNESVFVLCNILGEVLTRFTIKQVPHQDFEAWIKMATSAISTLLSSQSIVDEQLAAIGISSPGIISENKAHINKPQFGDFDANRLYSVLTENFSCPVYIKNATNASALGEWSEGAGKGMRNIVYVSCGQGLGCGFIVNNRLYEGSQVAAGEVANFITPQTLGCGKTLEQRICIGGLLTRIREYAPPELLSALPETPGLEDVIKLYEADNTFVRNVIEEITVELGCLVCNLVLTFNCDLVIMGGEECTAFSELMLPIINKMVTENCIVPAPVVASKLTQNASSRGMAAICREIYFDTICKL